MRRIVLNLVVAAALLCGCAKKGPPELTLEQVPEALKTAFASARPALRTNAEGIGSLVTEKKYGAASLQLQTLAANAELTEAQRSVVAGATIAVNARLQEVASAAEPAIEEPGKPAPPPVAKEEAAAAAAVLEHHIRTK